MSKLSFPLQPFSVNKSLLKVKIIGQIARRSNELFIEYLLSDQLAEVSIPSRADITLRKSRLWQKTCFECFVAEKNAQRYWEFNISPAGHWNVYRFETYRHGMMEESAFRFLPSTIEKHPECLSLALKIDLNKILKAEQKIEIGISAVTKLKNAELEYWSLIHPGAEADFHRRDSFIVEL